MSTNTLSISIIISAPPFSKIDGKEGVDLALVCAAFDQQVNLIFQNEGILHLLESQDENYFDDKSHDKQLQALEFYDIHQVYAEAESMLRFGLEQQDLIANTIIIECKQINALCVNSRQTVAF